MSTSWMRRIPWTLCIHIKSQHLQHTASLRHSLFQYPSSTSFICQRCLSTEQQEDRVKPPPRPRRYILTKLLSLVSESTEKLEKKIPSVFQVYRTFKTGLTSFVSESKDFMRISRQLWSGQSLSHFSRRELELYRQFSSDLPLVGFVTVIALAPGGAFVFPLAYVFPRFLLSHHFWTPQQKDEFRRIEMRKKVQHFDSILDYMHILSQHITNDDNRELIKKSIRKLDTSVHLTSNEVLALKPMFEDKPFHVDRLSIRHLRHLGKTLGISLRKKRMVKDALLLHFIDVAMVKEGINNLSNEELDRACSWRGLNPQGLGRGEKVSYLEHWTLISSLVHDTSISLLLHLPVLLAYCRPSNRELMGTRSSRARPRI